MQRVLDEGLEGLVLKGTHTVYEPGKRHWLKIKKDYLAEVKRGKGRGRERLRFRTLPEHPLFPKSTGRDGGCGWFGGECCKENELATCPHKPPDPHHRPG